MNSLKGTLKKKEIFTSLLSGISFILLVLPIRLTMMWLSVMTVILLYLVFKKKAFVSFSSVKAKKSILVFSVCVELIFGFLFVLRWTEDGKIRSFVNIFAAEGTITAEIFFYGLVILAAGILCLLSFPGCVRVSRFVIYPTTENRFGCVPIFDKTSIKEVCYLAVLAFCTITIASKSSFLYPFNEWDDANCFFTVGKAWANGMIPYRDIYEQKGPLLYAIHSLAYLIDSDSFIGMYFVETAACFFVLYYSAQIARLYGEKNIHILLALLCVIIYGSSMFCHGDSAEELCLPFLMFGLYKGLYYFKNENAPKIFQMAVAVGSACGIILWIKYTILGFYVGWALVFAGTMLFQKEWKKFMQLAAGCIIGFSVVSVPVIIYFYHADALKELFEVYFYNNIFYYGENRDGTMIINLLDGSQKLLHYQTGAVILILIGGFGFLHSMQRKEKIFVIMTFITTFFFAYFKKAYKYYGLPVSIFAIFGVLELSVYIREKEISWKKEVLTVCALLIGIFGSTDNSYLLLADRSELPQYQFAEYIKKSDDRTLLNYGFLDSGFYTACDVIPTTKYFCRLNIEYDEMYKEQKRYLEESVTEFVVTAGNIEDKSAEDENAAEHPNKERSLSEFAFNDPEASGNYKFIARSEYTLGGNNICFYLYQRK